MLLVHLVHVDLELLLTVEADGASVVGRWREVVGRRLNKIN